MDKPNSWGVKSGLFPKAFYVFYSLVLKYFVTNVPILQLAMKILGNVRRDSSKIKENLKKKLETSTRGIFFIPYYVLSLSGSKCGTNTFFN